MNATPDKLQQLHEAMDETLQASSELQAMFHEFSSDLESIKDHEYWGTFGDGFTPINYVPRLGMGERA